MLCPLSYRVPLTVKMERPFFRQIIICPPHFYDQGCWELYHMGSMQRKMVDFKLSSELRKKFNVSQVWKYPKKWFQWLSLTTWLNLTDQPDYHIPGTYLICILEKKNLKTGISHKWRFVLSIEKVKTTSVKLHECATLQWKLN